MSNPRDVLTRPATPPDRTVRYGPGADHVADIRLPEEQGPRPLVVVVHGGFWMAEFDRGHAGPQSAALAAAGYVVATVEYRRVGQPGGGWPGTFDDVAALTDAVPALVADSVGPRVDTARTVLVGHSAGGHLAAWAAARHRLPPGSPWHRAVPLDAAVVALAGVLDLHRAAELGLGGHAAALLLGGDPAERPERYAAASPASLLPSGSRQVLVHGTRDAQVPVEMSRRYVDRAAALGQRVALHELDGLGHFELIDPRSGAWPTVLDSIRELTR
ncbi:MAG: alpha/beta hydrolase family protein [Actinomycetes bacterium]